jgi:hypothetical protein
MMEARTFPKGKKQRGDTIQANKDIIRSYKTESDSGRNSRYAWVDSPLDTHDFAGTSRGKTFLESFDDVFPPEKFSLRSYIEEQLEDKDGQAIGVEFGGPGSKLFKGFSSGFFAKSVGVTLVDHRTPKEVQDSKKSDEKIHHQTLMGDIFDMNTYKLLNERLQGKKVDLIMSRMAAGLEFVPTEPYTVSKILEIWYELLSDEGIMFVQTPTKFNNLLAQWAKKIELEFKNVLEFQYKKGDVDANLACSAFRLRKLPGPQ